MSPAMLLGILLMVAALLFVLAPLLWPRVSRSPGEVEPAVEGRPSLERLRDELYSAIVELDFDHAVGKTDDEEYRAERADLKRQALAVLRLLDEQAARAGEAEDAEDAIEREVRDARASRRGEAAIEKVTLGREQAVIPSADCPHCGRELRRDDRFCSGCGQPIEPAVAGEGPASEDAALAEEVERQVGALRRERAVVGMDGHPGAVGLSNGRRGR
jgi:hypothetical protein